MPGFNCLSVNAPHTRTPSRFLSASVCPGLHSAENIAVTKAYVFPVYVAANSFWVLGVSTASASLAARVRSFATRIVNCGGSGIYPYEVYHNVEINGCMDSHRQNGVQEILIFPILKGNAGKKVGV
jgi:hypothetical protein